MNNAECLIKQHNKKVRDVCEKYLLMIFPLIIDHIYKNKQVKLVDFCFMPPKYLKILKDLKECKDVTFFGMYNGQVITVVFYYQNILKAYHTYIYIESISRLLRLVIQPIANVFYFSETLYIDSRSPYYSLMCLIKKKPQLCTKSFNNFLAKQSKLNAVIKYIDNGRLERVILLDKNLIIIDCKCYIDCQKEYLEECLSNPDINSKQKDYLKNSIIPSLSSLGQY